MKLIDAKELQRLWSTIPQEVEGNNRVLEMLRMTEGLSKKMIPCCQNCDYGTRTGDSLVACKFHHEWNKGWEVCEDYEREEDD